MKNFLLVVAVFLLTALFSTMLTSLESVWRESD